MEGFEAVMLRFVNHLGDMCWVRGRVAHDFEDWAGMVNCDPVMGLLNNPLVRTWDLGRPIYAFPDESISVVLQRLYIQGRTKDLQE